MSGSTLTIVLGDNGVHQAVLQALNLDSTPAVGVQISYNSDSPQFCGCDPNTGVLSPVAVGTANITGTGTRGIFTHSDVGVVTITAGAGGADFSVNLTLS